MEDNKHTFSNELNYSAKNTLLHLFVDYVAAQEPDPHTPEEIRECVETLQRKKIDALTPFQKIAKKKLNRLLPILLACNDDVNFVDSRGQTILHIFALHNVDECIYPKNDPSNDKKIVEILLERGASVDLVDLSKSTPVHYAVCNGRIDLAQLMLGTFTNVNAQNGSGNTVLRVLVSIYKRDPDELIIDVIRALVSKGANCKMPIKRSRSPPLTIAIRYGLIRILEIFKVNGADFERLLLHICKNAADWSCNYPDELQHLDRVVDLSKSVHLRTEEGHLTPLHYVSKFGRREAVEIFVNAGADIDAATVDGVTPLHLAVMEGHLAVVEFLIERGANLHARDAIFDFGMMHLAIYKGNAAIINLLIDNGLDVDEQSRDGIRPLHLAASSGNDWTIIRLIGHGADVNCHTLGQQLTPLHLASSLANHLLLDAIVANRFSLIHKNLRGKINGLQLTNSIIMLLQAGADVNARDSLLRTPLHYAARYGCSTKDTAKTILGSLLELGAWIDVEDNQNRTPLHVFDENRSYSGLKQLIRHGTDIDALNSLNMQFDLNGGNRDWNLWQHVKRMEAIDLPIKASHKREIEQAAMWVRKYDDPIILEKEIAKLKSHHLMDSEITMYKFLHMNSRDHVRCYFARGVLSLDLKSEYPLYQIIIENKCRQAINKMMLLDLAKVALKQAIHFELPDVCAEIICNYMSMPEITTFIHNVKRLS